MDTLSFKTRSLKASEVQHKWFIVDAEGKTVGRMCSRIATILRGKHHAGYTPHVDTGDYVIVINAEKVRFTGKKMTDKEYISYTGYPGGQKKRTPKEMLSHKPGAVVEMAVKGMLPKNKLGRAMFKKLFVYAGTEHPHQAQKPQPLEA